MKPSKLQKDLKVNAIFILTLPELVKVEENSHTHFAMDVSTPEEILEAADNCYHMSVVMPYNELVMKTLLSHSIYSELFFIAAPVSQLVAEDSLAKRYGIETTRLYPVTYVNQI